MSDLRMMYKREALGKKQDLRELVEFYEEFQRYIERLAAVVAGKTRARLRTWRWRVQRLLIRFRTRNIGSRNGMKESGTRLFGPV